MCLESCVSFPLSDVQKNERKGYTWIQLMLWRIIIKNRNNQCSIILKQCPNRRNAQTMDDVKPPQCVFRNSSATAVMKIGEQESQERFDCMIYISLGVPHAYKNIESILKETLTLL